MERDLLLVILLIQRLLCVLLAVIPIPPGYRSHILIVYVAVEQEQ